MNVKRTATLVVVGGAAAAWLYAAATSGARSTFVPTFERSSGNDARGETLAAEIARLHERLRPEATPRQPGRNLFTFTARREKVEPAASTPALSEAVALPIAAAPPFKLIGIGEDGPVRIAIISAPGQVFVVKVGENVTARYRVAKISADVVELVDVADDATTLRLAIR